LNNLNLFNKYQDNLHDTVNSDGIPKFSIYSSKNNKYFLLVYDTSWYESSSRTKCLFYKGEKLIWSENRRNSISDCIFFENNGAIIIKWDDPFGVDNFHLFYDSVGNITDTLNVNNIYGCLYNNELLIKRLLNDSLYLSIINSEDKILWKKTVSNQNFNVYAFESGNGHFILMTSKDSLYSYDNRFNLIWKKKFPRTNLCFSYSGKYFMADLSEPIPNTKYFKHLGYGVYDNNTGSIIKKIGIFKINGKDIIFDRGYFIDNTDLLLFYDIDSLTKKTKVVISNIKGEIISNFKYNQQYNNLSACVKNNILKLYNNSILIDSKIINYAP
jgi:hypothetical protein